MVELVWLIPAFPPAPIASNTQNAPTAPRMPATSESHIPLAGKLQLMPFENIRTARGASTATRKYATPTNRKAL